MEKIVSKPIKYTVETTPEEDMLREKIGSINESPYKTRMYLEKHYLSLAEKLCWITKDEQEKRILITAFNDPSYINRAKLIR